MIGSQVLPFQNQWSSSELEKYKKGSTVSLCPQSKQSILLYIALSSAAQEAVWIRQLTKDLQNG